MVAKAAPDGYTVGLFDTAFVINPTLYATLPQSPGIGFEAQPKLFAVMRSLVPGA